MLIMCYKIKEIKRQDIVKKLFSLKPKKKLNHLAWIVGRFDPTDIQISYDPNRDFDNYGCT